MNENPIPSNTISSLPQELIDACQKVSMRCFNQIDPTKISHIQIPDDRKVFKLFKSGEPIEVLISLLCRPILNVCELIRDEDDTVFSIELPLDKIKQKLSPTEISAEVILQHVLFSSGYMDRSFMIGLDFLHGEDTRFNAPVNMKYSETSYAIFDLENNHGVFPKYQSQKELLKNIWEAVLCLYDRECSSDITESDYRLFLESGRMDGNFGNHLMKKSQEILNQYNNDAGKELFFEQCKKSQVGENYNILYENFINNATLIHKTFSENSDALEEYICFDTHVALKDIYGHLRAIGRIIKYLLRGK